MWPLHLSPCSEKSTLKNLVSDKQVQWSVNNNMVNHNHIMDHLLYTAQKMYISVICTFKYSKLSVCLVSAVSFGSWTQK